MREKEWIECPECKRIKHRERDCVCKFERTKKEFDRDFKKGLEDLK